MDKLLTLYGGSFSLFAQGCLSCVGSGLMALVFPSCLASSRSLYLSTLVHHHQFLCGYQQPSTPTPKVTQNVSRVCSGLWSDISSCVFVFCPLAKYCSVIPKLFLEPSTSPNPNIALILKKSAVVSVKRQ